MLSRVANNLFWIGRYMERSYGILLTTQVAYSESQDFNINSEVSESNSESDFTSTLHYHLLDVNNLNSVYNLTYKARENCRSIQEEVSRELWLCLNNKYLFLRDVLNDKIDEDDPLKLIDEISVHNYLYYGIADLTQERGSAFCFMNCGKYLERIFRTIDFIESNIIKDKKESDLLEESIYWKNLLLSIGGYQLYLRTYKSSFKNKNIVDMLMFNKNFPHSIYYAIKKLETHILRLQNNHNNKENELIFLIGKLESTIKYTTLDHIFPEQLETVISNIKNELLEISNRFNEMYFSNY